MDYINTYEIDSFKCRIPISKVTIINSNIGIYIDKLNRSTGEIIESEEPEKKVYSDIEIPTEFTIEKVNVNGQDFQTFITIKVTSKHLRPEYFQGITIYNVEEVYNSIIAESVIKFDYITFLHSEVTDIDFKMDIETEHFDLILSDMISNAKPSKKITEGINYRNRKDNQFIQFSRRETAKISNPYIKIYNKSRELNNRSTEFNHKYLNNYCNDNLYRVEFTLKNKKMYKAYGVQGNRLIDFLELPEDKKRKIATEILKKHTESRTNKAPTEVQNTTELLIYDNINLSLKTGRTIETTIDNFVNQINSRATKNRYKKIYKSVYEKYFQSDKRQVRNEEIEEIYKTIGFM